MSTTTYMFVEELENFAQHVANGGDQCLNFTVFTVCIRTDRPEQTV